MDKMDSLNPEDGSIAEEDIFHEDTKKEPEPMGFNRRRRAKPTRNSDFVYEMDDRELLSSSVKKRKVVARAGNKPDMPFSGVLESGGRCKKGYFLEKTTCDKKTLTTGVEAERLLNEKNKSKRSVDSEQLSKKETCRKRISARVKRKMSTGNKCKKSQSVPVIQSEDIRLLTKKSLVLGEGNVDPLNLVKEETVGNALKGIDNDLGEEENNLEGCKNSDSDILSGKSSSTALVKKRRGCPNRNDIGFVVDPAIFYVIVSNGTQRGQRRLVSSDGYTYNMRRKTTNTKRLDWKCSYRPKFKKDCQVTIRHYKETGTFKKRGEHIHGPAPSAFIDSVINSELKKKSTSDLLSNPREVVETMFKDNEALSRSGSQLKVNYLVRRMNRLRESVKKQSSVYSGVKVDKEVRDNFLVKDIILKNRRHIVFATQKQLRILTRADRWYIDVTQKFSSPPFNYLMSISAFVLAENSPQVVRLRPLAFVVMTQVIRGLLKSMKKPIYVRSFVLDYHESLWLAIRALFFNCKLYGCAWKFSNCMWTKIQELGLKEQQVAMYEQIHKLLKLPFLPPKEIRLTVQILQEEFLNRPVFKQLLKYIETTWLNNPVWQIHNWSVYGNPFRTKAEVIGWQCCMRLVKEKNVILNSLVKELSRISQSATSIIRPVHQPSVRRFYHGNFKTPQGKIFNLWDEETVMSHSEFLVKCCELSEPIMEGMVERMVKEYRMQMKEYS